MRNPFIILNYGGGTQSSFLALASSTVEGRRYLGIDQAPDIAVFADTGAEPDTVYGYLKYIRDRVDFPISTVKRPVDYTILEEHRHDPMPNGHVQNKMPMFSNEGGMSRRMCTTHWKVLPIKRFVRSFLEEKGVNWRRRKWPEYIGDRPVIQWIAYSFDEAHRMSTRNDTTYSRTEYPIVEARIKRQQAIDWLAEHDYQAPTRSACICCPYRTDAEWQSLTQLELEQVAHCEESIQKAERRSPQKIISYFHKSKLPIRSRPFDPDKRQQQFNFDRDGEGACTDGCWL